MLNVKLDKDLYLSGEEVICHISIQVRKPLKIRSLEVEFFGKFYAEILVDDGEDVQHIIDKQDIFRERKIIWNSKGEDWSVWEPNLYELDIDFQLPQDLVPSFPYSLANQKMAYGKVEYGVQVKIDKVRALDPKRTVNFLVENPEYVCNQLSFPMSNSVEDPRGLKPSIYIDLERTDLRPGEKLIGQLVYKKLQTPYKVRNVELYLKRIISRHVKDYSPRKKDLIFERKTFGNSNEIDTSFEFMIPYDAMPSVDSRVLKISWELHVKADIAWRRDVNLHVPILIGGPECKF